MLGPETGDDSGLVRALILELIEGETLADRIGRSPLPVPEGLAIARQIADALHGAHEKGIIHRDLKPSNIKITPERRVKILDFGLAKAMNADVEASHSPTVTSGGTREGVVLGTAAYMSPEQARGLPVDKRTDIWAFGCVLYEMLTGRRAFAGETITDTLVAILEREPEWAALPEALPAHVTTALRRCLQKDPGQRLGDIGEARSALETIAPEGSRHTTLSAPVADRRRRLLLRLSAGGVLAIALVSGVWQWRMSTSSVNPVRSLAILPLKPVQQNPEEDHLGLGIADTIITRIGQIEGMAVRPTSSVRRYGSAESDALSAARELSVDAVLDGTFQRAGDRLRINLNLVRVSDGASLWSRSFSTTFADIFAVEDEIAQQVVGELRLRLTAGEQARLAKRYTSSPEAYEYYVKGIRTFGTVGGAGATAAGEVDTGLKMLERAVEIDPGYALAHAQLAWGYTWFGLFTPNAGSVWINRAREALARANTIDPDLAEAHVVRSLLLYSFFEGYQIVPAFDALKAAQRLNPNVGHFELAVLYFHVGMIDFSLRAFQRAIEIDPTNAANSAEIVNALYMNARYQEAIAAAEKLSPRPRGWLQASVGGGDVAEARRQLTEALARNPNDNILRGLNARLLAREGKFREAEAALGTPTEAERRNRNYHHGAYSRACVYALGARADRAVEWMHETVEHGMPNFPAFSRDPCFDPIRHTVVFKEFMSDLKPTWEGYERALQ